MNGKPRHDAGQKEGESQRCGSLFHAVWLPPSSLFALRCMLLKSSECMSDPLAHPFGSF